MTENPWHDWLEAWPDWADDGRRVELVLENGRTVDGILRIDDVVPDGEGDEYPIWIVTLDDGGKLSFAGDMRKWRFLSRGGLSARA
jgi:hypothetical protein